MSIQDTGDGVDSTAQQSATVSAGGGPQPIRRALVVDDDPDINRLLRVRLTARGYHVAGAANGKEALEQIGQFSPDIVFLDVSMPVMGGLEALEKARASGVDAAIIMTTAFGSEQVAIDTLRLGADDYLRKPFEPHEFNAVLHRAVARLELSRRNAYLQQQLDQKRRQLEEELVKAAGVQSSLLPVEVPDIPGFELAAKCIPALEVGGDLYDWQAAFMGNTAIVIGDVSGKGMSAALLMAAVRATLRGVTPAHPPATAIDIAERALFHDFQRAESFVTLFYAHVDSKNKRVTFVDAGHGYAFVRRAGGAVERLSPRGFPLGVMPEERYEQGSFTLGPGDALITHSDGLLDASEHTDLTPESMSARLAGANSAREMVDRLIAMPRRTGSPPDDLTVMVLRCN